MTTFTRAAPANILRSLYQRRDHADLAAVPGVRPRSGGLALSQRAEIDLLPELPGQVLSVCTLRRARSGPAPMGIPWVIPHKVY